MEIVKNIPWSRLRKFRWLLIASIGLLTIGWLFNTPSGLLGKADAIGYAVCHRIDSRSFHLGDRQIPLCARCTGMFLGAMLGLGFQAFSSGKRSGSPPVRVILVLMIFVIAFIVDGLNSYVSLIPGVNPVYKPENILRLFTGTGVGLVLAAALFPAFNQSVWKINDGRPALGSLRILSILIALAIVLDLIVLTENPIFLYPLALVSAAGVVVLLTMVYTIIILMVLRKEGQYNHLKELLFPFTLGFGMALLQIALLDFIRYWLTGTWDGFNLG
jgi:uncharacterized membrane protein